MQFVSHKVSALGRLIDKYGVYISHLTILAEDPDMKSVDKQRIQGYIHESKMFLGSAFTIYLNRMLYYVRHCKKTKCAWCVLQRL